MIYTSPARSIALVDCGRKNNPFVAYDNLAALGTLGGTATLTGGAAVNAVSTGTYSSWLPNISGTTAIFQVSFAATETISFAAIAAHNLGTLGGSLAVEYSADNVTWVDGGCGVVTPANNAPVAFRMVDISARYWRFAFSGLTAAAPLYVSVAFLGQELIFPRRFYQGFAPVVSPTEVQLQSNVSVGGNLLGSSIVTEGSTVKAPFRLIPPDFVRSDMAALIPHFNRGGGLFFGWRPSDFAADLHYCWRDGATLRPTIEGPLDFMSFELNLRVYEG